MKKLKDLLNESQFQPQMGKVYSNPYATAFVKESEEELEGKRTNKVELTSEQKQAFLEAVKQYKKYSEVIYRNAGLEEVYNSIKELVGAADKVTLSETEDWFDNVTVSRHMKRMGESFKVFEKTLKEVGTLQQRLESSYDEIGEVLGKYYEISEELDPVGKEDGDVDNDGDEDESDDYLANRRKVVSKAIKNESMKLTDMITKPSVNESKPHIGKDTLKTLKKGHKIKWYSPKGIADDEVEKVNGIYIKLKSGGTIPYQSIVKESVNEASLELKKLEDAIKMFQDKIEKQGRVTNARDEEHLQNLIKVYKQMGGKNIKESVVNEAKYDIGMGRVGNGITVYNRAEEEDGDYKKVAHISNNGTVKYYDTKLPNDVKKKIEAEAQKMKESVNEGKDFFSKLKKGDAVIGKFPPYTEFIVVSTDGKTGKTIDIYSTNNYELKESTNEGTKMIKLKNLLNESFGFGELPSDKLMKMKVSAKEMLDSVNPKKVNEVYEEEDVVEEARASAKSLLQSVIKGESSRIEGIKLSKKAAEGLLDWLMVSPYGKKFPNLPFHMLLKASFNWGLHRYLDKNSKEYKDLQAVAEASKMKESVVTEGKVIVYNEKTGERYEVLSGSGKGDLLIAMNALQKAAPSHMKYSIK
jgi:hypothetical protein